MPLCMQLKRAPAWCAGPGSHYCENVGRCHASNHAYIVLSLCSGQYAQKCYDPDCAGFRSAWMPLPPDLVLRTHS